jgi:hypothetical protein
MSFDDFEIPPELRERLKKLDDELQEAKKKEQEKRQSQATALLGLIQGEAELWHTPDREAWATITVGAHREHHRVQSRSFKRWAQRQFFLDQKASIGGQGVRDALGVIEGIAIHDGDEHEVSIRVAEQRGALYLDLANADWHAVEIAHGGWTVVHPPVRFARPGAMRPLPAPVRGGSLDELWDYVNVRDALDRRLLIASLIGAFRARGPFVIVMLYGEQGSAKSTTARICRMLIDPNKADVRSAPREPRDVVILAQHSWVLALDNVSSIPEWLSDGLCRLATGGGYAARALYTDSDEVVVDAMRPSIITGIVEVAERGDLLDRTIGIELEPVRKRRTEKDLYAAFEEAQPRILGALLDAVAYAHAHVGDVEFNGQLPRMADYAAFISAAEPHLGWKRGQVVRDLEASRAHLNELPLDHSVIAPAIRKAVSAEFELVGTSTEVLALINVSADKFDETARRDRRWPKTPAALSRELARLAPNLRAAGICAEKLPRTDAKGTRGWTVHVKGGPPCPTCQERGITDGSSDGLTD